VEKLLISMPDSENPESIITINENAVNMSTIISEDTCDTGTGYALDKVRLSDPRTCSSGKQDCCGWYVKTHVHDLGNVSEPVDLYVQYKTGLWSGCQDNVTFWVSGDDVVENASWELVGSKLTNSTDMDGNPVFPQAWATHSMVIRNVTTPFRWVKVSAMKCFDDWSYVTVSKASENNAPTAVIEGPSVVTVGKKAVFGAFGSVDDGGIDSYAWKFGDHSTGNGAVVSHVYTGNWTWNGSEYRDDAPHDYTVQLMAKDLDGAVGVVYKTIRMVDYDVDNPPIAYFVSNVTEGEYPLAVRFDSLSDDDGNLSLYWSFNSTDESVDYLFTKPGVYDVVLDVADDLNQTDNYSVVVNATGEIPVPVISYPENGSVLHSRNVPLYYTASYHTADYPLVLLDNDSQPAADYNESDGWYKDPNDSPTAFKDMGDGWHVLRVKYVDVAGNVGDEANVTVYVDAGAPVVVIDSPANGTNVSKSLVTVNFSTMDADVEEFDYKTDNGTWVDTGITPNGSSYSFNFTELDLGEHELWIRAVDYDGNNGTAYVDVNVTVAENLKPVVNVSYPAGYYTSVDAVKFTAVDDNASSMDCEYSVDGGDWLATDSQAGNDSEYSQGISVDNSSSGEHYVMVRCFDGAKWSDDVRSDFFIDVDGPVVWFVDAPGRDYYFVNGSSWNGTDYTNNATVFYDWNDDVGVAYYELKHNSTNDGTTTERSYWFDVADGNYSLYVRGVDSLGNVGEWANVNVSVDTVNPELEITSPLNNTNTSDENTWIKYETEYDEAVVTYIKLNDGSWVVIPDNPSPPYTKYPEELSKGPNLLSLKVVDHAGNYNISSTIKINIGPYGPNTTITTENNSNYSVDDVDVHFYSDDEDIETFQYSYDGSAWNDTGINATGLNGTVFNYTIPNVPEGASKVYIRGKNTGGYYGTPANITVNVNSIFTNLRVDIVAQDLAIDSTPFEVDVFVTNYNEETIPAGVVELNLSEWDCTITEGRGAQYNFELKSGESDWGEWKVVCGIDQNETMVGTMKYLPTGQEKNDSAVVEVVPYSQPEPGVATVEVPSVTLDYANNRIVF
jgi:hypothetical protein